MFDVGDSLREAMTAAHTRLRDAQAAVARANSGVASGRSADAAMAQAAQAAIFTEALLGVGFKFDPTDRAYRRTQNAVGEGDRAG